MDGGGDGITLVLGNSGEELVDGEGMLDRGWRFADGWKDCVELVEVEFVTGEANPAAC